MGANTYPIEEWVITEEKFLKEWNYRTETTFALSNGYIKTKKTFNKNYFLFCKIPLKNIIIILIFR